MGMQIDDITADYARPIVSELWNVFDADGSMAGDYDCDRLGQMPIRVPFRGCRAARCPTSSSAIWSHSARGSELA